MPTLYPAFNPTIHIRRRAPRTDWAPIVKTDGGREASGFKESKDCTVRSLACVAGIPYIAAHDIMRRAGRRPNHGHYPVQGLAVAQKDGLLEAVPVAVHLRGALTGRLRYPTLAQVVARHPKGRYIISTRRHAMALIDGVIHDTGLSGARKQVVEMFEVKLKTSQPAITQPQINDLWARLNALEAKL